MLEANRPEKNKTTFRLNIWAEKKKEKTQVK